MENLIIEAQERVIRSEQGTHEHMIETLAFAHLMKKAVTDGAHEVMGIIFCSKTLPKFVEATQQHYGIEAAERIEPLLDSEIIALRNATINILDQIGANNVALETINTEFQQASKVIIDNTDKRSNFKSNIMIGLAFYVAGTVTPPLIGFALKAIQ